MSDSQPASAAQTGYLRYLAEQRAMYGTDLNRAATITRLAAELDEMTKDAAITLIDKALKSPPHAADQFPATARDIKRVRDYAAEYALFGLTVSVEDTIARVEAAINADFFSAEQAREFIRVGYRAQPHPTAQTPLRLVDIEGIEGLDVSEGHYAVFNDADVLRFYRIYTPATGALKGEGVIRRFAGDNLKGLYPAEALVALKAINSDPDAAAFRFADTFTRCWVCGRHLTDAISRLLSVGPTCRGFANHTGLRNASNEVDHDPARREVFRALREWALTQGFVDPRNREDRASIAMSASRVASAWSGIPGVLGLSPDAAVEAVNAALRNEISDTLREGLTAAPVDTLLILVETGILSAEVMRILATHPNKDVKAAANEFFLAQLGM